MASYSIKACDRGGIAFLESPTGTGKSLALLCAVLAWQRRQAEKVTTVPQIVYGVRTHSQIKQIVGELRKCGYRPRMAVIGSRDQLCANETVKSEARRGRVSLNLSCRQAARCAVANLPGGCNLYRGLGQNSYAQRVHDRYGQAGRIWDVEELLSCAQRKASDQIPGCPYYTAHVLAGDADIVFCPQNYILDPSVSQCRSHHRERWSLKGRIVIIDEAHNVETCCREAGSLEITNQELWQISRTLRQMPLRHSNLRFGERRSCAQAAEELEKLPLQLCAFLGRHRTATTATTNMTSPLDSHVLWGLGSQSTKLFLQQCGLAPSGLLSKTMEELAIEAIDRLLQAQLNESSTDADDAELLSALEKLRDLIFKLRLAHKHSDSYVVAINPQGDATRLCLWLMSPGVLFEVFASQAHCVLLASGTLAPLGALQAELMASDALASRALREGPLEARHIVHPWQLFAAVLPCADRCNAPIVSTYGNWQSEEFVQALGASVLRLVSYIPGGVLCFLPSYQSLDLALLFWRRSGLWQDLAKVKVLVTEPRQASEMPEAARQFMAGVGGGPGALCFAVYRGKMSEGLDFADDLCRAVICIGVPYPQMNDPVVVAKRRWNDACCRGHGGHGRLSGDQWYELQAHRAVNQALGRLLRHSGDYGALILLDARWARRGQKSRNLRAKLSGWIQRHLVDWPCSASGLSGNVFGRLKKHFEDAARRPLPALPSPPLPAVPTPLRCEATSGTSGTPPPKRRFVDTLTGANFGGCHPEGSMKPALTFIRMESTWSPALPLASSQSNSEIQG